MYFPDDSYADFAEVKGKMVVTWLEVDVEQITRGRSESQVHSLYAMQSEH